MIYALKPVCKKEWVGKKRGTSTIFIQYCLHSSPRTLLNTRIAIPPQYWNRKSLRIYNDLPAQFGDPNHLNEELARMMRLAEDILRYCLKNTKDNPLNFLKATFSPDFDMSLLEKRMGLVANLDVYYQFDEYIEIKRKKIAPSTVLIYQEVKKYLQAFEKYRGRKITFKSFDLDFYDAFVDFLTYEYESYRYTSVKKKGIRINTMGKAIKHLRLFLKDRIRRKIIPDIDLSEYKVMEEIADATFLDMYEIETIYKLDLSLNPKLEIARDLLVHYY
jgi:hypothetical protein